jgi:hypothetical protein
MAEATLIPTPHCATCLCRIATKAGVDNLVALVEKLPPNGWIGTNHLHNLLFGYDSDVDYIARTTTYSDVLGMQDLGGEKKD